MIDSDRVGQLLKELAEKYEVGAVQDVETENGSIVVHCGKVTYRFFYDFSEHSPKRIGGRYIDVPLFHWRSSRRFRELKNIVSQGIVSGSVAMRVKNLSPASDTCRAIEDVMMMEFDLLEWMLDDTIQSVFSCMGDQHCNYILTTEKGLRAAAEIGILPSGSEPIVLHEIICRTGVISDTIVDTQIKQYPIYVFRKDKVTTYSDVDFELYGLDGALTDCVRFILEVLGQTEDVATLNGRYEHYRHLRDLTLRSSTSVTRLVV